jgi:tetratricopeptide (TPR) repeat protein
MVTSSHVEELFLEAESAIRNNNYSEAKHLLEQALAEEHEFAPAHNSLGWIYKSQVENYEVAENHFKAAIAFWPNYAHSYWNMIDICIENDRWNEALRWIEKAAKVASTGKSHINYKKAYVYENQQRFDDAELHYEKALLLCMNNDRMESLKKDVERVRYKISMINSISSSPTE